MSLVAYNASDESDEDSDGGTLVGKQSNTAETEDTISGHISDEEEFETVSSTTLATTSSVLKPLLRNSDLADLTSIASLEDLPAPRSVFAAAIQEEDELEEEVKPRAFEVENAQKPPEKKKQPVKITIPSLDKTDIDEEENVQKKPTPSLTKSGLFSLLPPPIHSAKKEINRPLIPHTLSKKPQNIAQTSSQAKPHIPIQKPSVATSSGDSLKAISTKRVALNIAMYGSDSEDDDGDNVSSSNFFSLDSVSNSGSSKSDSDKSLQIKEISSSEASFDSLSSSDVQIKAVNSIEQHAHNETNDKETVKESESIMTRGPEPGAVNNAPLDFGHANSKLWSSSPSPSTFSEGYLEAVGLAGPVTTLQSSLQGQGYNVAATSAQYNLADTVVFENSSFDAVGDDDLKQFMSDKEFQRLSGKRKRGLEEAINFVDANVDDYVDPSEVSKHLTEETEYVSHKNKDNMPTAQQRRKKQITYLAYQAKERELELKNAWAQNKMTKKQTQSKYGF